LLQLVRGGQDQTSRRLRHRFDGVAACKGRRGAACGTNQGGVVGGGIAGTAQVGRDGRQVRRGVGGLPRLQRPLLLGAVDLPQVVDTGVHLSGGARFHEIGNRDRRQQ